MEFWIENSDFHIEINSDSSYRDARGFGGMLLEIIWEWLMQSGVFWCVILIWLSLKKVSLFIFLNIDYSYTPGYTLAISYFAPRVKNIL